MIRWSLYWYLDVCDNHLSQNPDDRKTGYNWNKYHTVQYNTIPYNTVQYQACIARYDKGSQPFAELYCLIFILAFGPEWGLLLLMNGPNNENQMTLRSGGDFQKCPKNDCWSDHYKKEMGWIYLQVIWHQAKIVWTKYKMNMIKMMLLMTMLTL